MISTALLGQMNTLRVVRTSPHGLLLDGGERGEILLPNNDAARLATPPPADVEVFLYRDSEDRLIATTTRPKAMAGEFASLQVIGFRPGVGSFLDWGLSKDLLLPLREHQGHVQVGDQVVVRVYVDEKSDRIAATMRYRKWLDDSVPDIEKNHPVRLLIARTTPLGYAAIVENRWIGALFHSDLAGPLAIGSTMRGFIKKIRPDGKLDLALDAAGFGRIKPLGEVILARLREAGGHLPLHDRSSPEEIRQTFECSKKAFKQAVGALYRKHQIELTPSGMKISGRGE